MVVWRSFINRTECQGILDLTFPRRDLGPDRFPVRTGRARGVCDTFRANANNIGNRMVLYRRPNVHIPSSGDRSPVFSILGATALSPSEKYRRLGIPIEIFPQTTGVENSPRLDVRGMRPRLFITNQTGLAKRRSLWMPATVWPAKEATGWRLYL
ncbi:hypothetical protein BV22DRAFT_73819 [Leucogyrophana mollusca]|uniref:Uncharacterized protein n=1 Tax=Leucogyrophana mollusca TaxID=85980 RepID=A0ACB8BWN9_9AGAM|nr:hypothetical protein BV22DRAFT_73819 [Leucogyrophana mollusca]